MKKQKNLTRSQLSTRKKKKEKVMLFILIPLFTFVLGIAIYGAKLLAVAQHTAHSSFEEIDRVETVTVQAAKEPTGILIMGVDNSDSDDRNLGSIRADSLIYMALNPDKKDIQMVSIPRDTYTPILKNGTILAYNRINAAYAMGKEKVTIESVEHLLDVPVHYYATVDFDAFMDIIDALGGVQVDVPITFSENNAPGRKGGIHLTKGLQKLNGEEALALARTRKIDNDVKRGERQQLIIKSVMEQALKVDAIPKYTSIIESVDGNLKTNMRVSDMVALLKSGLGTPYTIDSHTFEWTDFEKNGAAMITLNEESLLEIQGHLKQTLYPESTSVPHSDSTSLDSSQALESTSNN